MRIITGTLFVIAALCGIWILFVEFTDKPEQSTQPTPAATSTNATHATSPPTADNRINTRQTSSQRTNRPTSRQAPKSSPQVDKLMAMARENKVSILSLSQIGGGVHVIFNASDHISTGNLLDSLTRSGLVRDFDQIKVGPGQIRNGRPSYNSEFKLYWK